MKSSQIKIYGRAAMLGRRKTGAAIILAAILSWALWGFMTANVRLILSAGEIDRALSTVGSVAAPAVNIAACAALLLLGLLLYSPIKAAAAQWFMLGAAQKKGKAGVRVRYAPRYAFGTLRASLAVGFFKTAITLLFCAPGAVLTAGGIYMLFTSGAGAAVLTVLLSGGVVLLVAGALFSLCACGCYEAVWYILAMRPETSVRSAIAASGRIMQGKYLSLLLFKLSFLPVLSMCIFIVPAVFILPYYRQSCAIWMLDAVKNSKKELNKA